MPAKKYIEDAGLHRNGRRYDPGRRDRILKVTLDLIAEVGVGDTTMRRVAERADVPLGSMTYHFDNRESLLMEAFTNYSQEMASIFEMRFTPVSTREEAKEALVEHICGDSWANERNLLIGYEMYAYTSRAPQSRAVMQNWIDRVRRQFERFFDRSTADALDALVEGYTMHRSVDREPPQREDIERIIKRVAG